ALGSALGRFLEQAALEEEADRAAAIASLLLDAQLRIDDFAAPPSIERYAAIDRLIRERVLDRQIVRVKIWNAAGLVVYSDDPALVGQHYPIEDELAQALAGRLAIELSDLGKAENDAERASYVRLMEVYVPVRLDGATVV